MVRAIHRHCGLGQSVPVTGSAIGQPGPVIVHDRAVVSLAVKPSMMRERRRMLQSLSRSTSWTVRLAIGSESSPAPVLDAVSWTPQSKRAGSRHTDGDLTAVFYVDGHVRAYQGTRKVAKTHLSARALSHIFCRQVQRARHIRDHAARLGLHDVQDS